MKAHLLVVDDVQEILDLYRLILEEEGYELYLSVYAYEDVKDVEHLCPHLIILDLMFNTRPAGWELLKKLKAYPSTKSIPILLCTAIMSLPDEMADYVRKQEIPVIYKPFEIDDFLQVTRRLLEGSFSVSS